MFFLTQLHTVRRTALEKCCWKRFLTQMKNVAEEPKIVSEISEKFLQNFITPTLSKKRLKEINEVTGIAVKMGHTSWIRISTQSLKVIEWNFQSHPENFKNMDEVSVYEVACSLMKVLPESDLYILEKSNLRESSKLLNNVRLLSMLMVFLNKFNDGAEGSERVVFQKENIMNTLHNLLIGNERVSARKIFESGIQDMNQFGNSNISSHQSGTFQSLIKSNLEYLEFYDKSSLTQQESLSFVLLLTLSFMDVFIYQDVESLTKIQAHGKFRKKKN